MLFYNSAGPNPRMVRMFLLEKGLSLPQQDVDILGGENRQPEYVAKNPAGQTPALQLDDGTIIGETVAICEYLEELNPEPPLIGSNAQERAETRMWVRRVELHISENLYNGFRFAEGLDLFRDRIPCMPESADRFKERGQIGLAWLDGLMSGKSYICGERLTIIDLALYCCLDFVASVGQPRNPALKHLAAWYERIAARPSAEASLSPNWEQMGMRM